MKQGNISIEERAKEWFLQGLTRKQIEQQLYDAGFTAADIPHMMKEITRLRNAQKTTRGLSFVLAGAALCLVSCILTITLPQSNTTLVLYGLTSLGIIIVFYGLMQIFG